jgi:dTDP-glucose 4,6-dehydratase
VRVLVTGAAGFLGSHLCDRFLADGHSVVGADNFVTGHRENLSHLTNEPRFSFEECDVSERMPRVGKVDGVLHFASPASPPDYQRVQIATMRVNSIGTTNCLELAHEHGARFFVASTSEVYGDPLVHPQPESYWGNVNPIGLRSMYDEAKRFAEAVTMAYNRERGVDTRIVRIFNTYGPRMRPRDGRVVSNFIVQALNGEPLTVYGDGTQTRSFCFVDDEIEGIFRLFRYEGEGQHEPCNVGNPGEYTMLELAQIVQDVTGTDAPIVHRPLPADDPKQRRPDISRAKRLLGWEPRVQVRDGVSRTAAYFKTLLGTERMLA